MKLRDFGIKLVVLSLIGLSVNSQAARVMDAPTPTSTTLALDVMIRTSVALLNREGFRADADRIEAEWNAHYVNLATLDLGDHSPLSRWLVDVYDRTESRVGIKLMEVFYLTDMKVMNFAPPVVFRPESVDEPEYLKHFVPLASAVTYWGSYAGCSALLQFPVTLACGLVARVPRKLMEKEVAPRLGHETYITATTH